MKKEKQSLYISLLTTAFFLLAIFTLVSSPVQRVITTADNAMAGSQEEIEYIDDEPGVPPIGGSEEEIPTATPRATATPRPTVTATPSAIPVITALPTSAPTTPIEDTFSSPTPIPTFNLNLPGDTSTGPTPPPARPVGGSGTNIAVVAGISFGLLLMMGGIAILFMRRKKNPPENDPKSGFNQGQQSMQSGQTQYNTPYDQYISNKPGDNNQQ